MEPTVKRHGPVQAPGSKLSRRRRFLIGIAVAGLIAAASFGGARVAAARRFQAELAQARDEMGAGLFTLARSRLVRLSSNHPEQPEIAYQLGRCEAARGRPESRAGAMGTHPR